MSQLKHWINTFLDNGFSGSDLSIIEGRAPWARGRNMADVPVPDGYCPTREEMKSLYSGLHNAADLERSLEAGHGADFAFTLDGKRIRANLSWQGGRNEMRAALRVLNDSVPELDTLGLPTELLQAIVSRRSGIILVTGETGSGKSTTLASLLMERAKRPDHIITLESPIEYPLTELALQSDAHRADVQQVEIGSDAASYAAALRSALRQDPDIILIGEINDEETAEHAFKAAATGHLVLATLHTRSAATSIENLINRFPAELHDGVRASMAEYLIAVISQALIPDLRDGRVLASEVLTSNTAIRSHIRNGKLEQIQNSILEGGRDGMYSLNKSLLNLMRDGRIDKDAAMMASNDSEALARGQA